MSNRTPKPKQTAIPAAKVSVCGNSAGLYKSGLLIRYVCQHDDQQIFASMQETFSENDTPAASLRAELLLQARNLADRDALAAICTASRIDRAIVLDSTLPMFDLHGDELAAQLPWLLDSLADALGELPLVLRHLHPTLHPQLFAQLSGPVWQRIPAGHGYYATATELAAGNNLYLKHDLTLGYDDCQLLDGSALCAADYPRLQWLSGRSSIKAMRHYLPGFIESCASDSHCRLYALKLSGKLVAMMITHEKAGLFTLLAIGCDPALSPAYAAERRLLAQLYRDALASKGGLLLPAGLSNYCHLRGFARLALQHAFWLGSLPARQRLAASGLLEHLRQQHSQPAGRATAK